MCGKVFRENIYLFINIIYVLNSFLFRSEIIENERYIYSRTTTPSAVGVHPSLGRRGAHYLSIIKIKKSSFPFKGKMDSLAIANEDGRVAERG